MDDLKHFDEARQNQSKLVAMKNLINQVCVWAKTSLKYLLILEASEVLCDFFQFLRCAIDYQFAKSIASGNFWAYAFRAIIFVIIPV